MEDYPEAIEFIKYKACFECSKEANKKCSECHLARYCSRDCQIKHWPKHKKVCVSSPETKSILKEFNYITKRPDILDIISMSRRLLPKGTYIHIIRAGISTLRGDNKNICSPDDRIILVNTNKIPSEIPKNSIPAFIVIKEGEFYKTCPIFIDHEETEPEKTINFAKFLNGEYAIINDTYYNIGEPLW